MMCVRVLISALVVCASSSALSALGGCSLQASSGHVGEECDDARDCDAENLGCVPVDFDNPGARKACMPPPEEFSCRGELYGDDACDCGCGVIDIDCANATSGACAGNGNQCPEGENPDPADNSQCI